MKSSNISFLSIAETITLLAYDAPRKHSVLISELVSRLAATILLSTSAALDIAIHSSFILPTFIYSTGKSIYQWKLDFTLPWQHIQRVRNSIAPLLLGSIFGALHPFAGLIVSEPTDKHIALGILSSNISPYPFDTPCSPIHSLSIVEDLAKKNQYVEKDGIRREIFSAEHLKVIQNAKSIEKSLESLQAQEYIHKITNTTLYVMSKIITGIEESKLDNTRKFFLLRMSGLLIPILTTIDITITLIAQAFFLTTGIIRIISGRGPIYTDVTTNPLMHVSFLIQNILKSMGNLLGTVIWFASPITGFKVSLLPANGFFKIQMKLLMLKIRIKMYFIKNNTRFVIPIVFGNGELSAFSVPTHSSHKTYLIVEKIDKQFNLFWINRPTVLAKKHLNSEETLGQIQSMLDERFPFMDIKKIIDYPVFSDKPRFPECEQLAEIHSQGNKTNCVVSNLFGMLETIDRLRGEEFDITKLRNAVVRESLAKSYEFYEREFNPFGEVSEAYSLKKIWDTFKISQDISI